MPLATETCDLRVDLSTEIVATERRSSFVVGRGPIGVFRLSWQRHGFPTSL
jgi:hypothetical protein